MRAAIVAFLVVGGCTSPMIDVARPAFPLGGVGTAPTLDAPPLPMRRVTVGGRSYASGAIGALSFRELSVCDASKEVLGTMGIAYTCAASGVLSFETQSSDPNKVLSLFVGALERMGVTVTATEAGLNLSSGRGRGAAGDDESLSGFDGFSEVEGGAVAVDIDLDVADVILDRSASFSPVDFAVIPVGYRASDVEAVVSALGLDVEVVQDREQGLVIGSSADVTTAISALKIGETGVLALDIPPMSESVMESLSVGFGVSVSLDETSGKTVFVGPSYLVFDAVKASREIGGTRQPVRVSVAFVRYSRDEFDRQAFEGSLSYDAGNVLLRGGSMPIEGLRLAFDQEQFRSFASLVSEPSLVVVSGSEASFLAGSSVPVLGSVDDEGAQDVEYRDAGVSVVVTPFVSGGVVRAVVRVEVSSVIEGSDASTPSFDTTSIETEVSARFGQVVGLSGFTTSADFGRDGTSLFLPSLRSRSGETELGIYLTFEGS